MASPRAQQPSPADVPGDGREPPHVASRRRPRVELLSRRLGRSVIRGRSEPELLDEQCRILVAGGFQEALVLMRTARGGDIHAAAHAGEQRLLRLVKSPNAHTLRHMVARVVRDRKPEIARRDGGGFADAQDPARRDEALAMLPLCLGGPLDGALVLYTTQPRAFSPEEVKLLADHSADLGCGIEALREQQRLERAGARLRAAEERYAGIFENAPEGIFAATRGGRLKLANPAFARLLGYDNPSQLLAAGGELARLLAPDDFDRLLTALETGATEPPLELALRQRSGDTVWVSLNAQVVATFDGAWIEGFVQDLTPLRAEREASHRLAAIVEATEVAILMKRLDGVIESWNPGAETLFGYTKEEAVGRPGCELIVPAHLVDEEQEMLDSVGAGRRVTLETQRMRKDGTLVDVAMSASPIFAADGSVVAVSITEQDITDRKQQEATRRALERQRAEVRKLEAVDRLRTEFINEASHELKTPLTPVITHLQILQDRDDLDATVRRSIHVIERNAHRMQALVNDMLDVSRIEAGYPGLEIRRTEIGLLVRDAVESFAHDARRNGVELDVSTPESLWATIDRARITQVLFNLIDNAVKFSNPGGEVRLSTQTEADHLLITVADGGAGLSQEQLTRLFRPFAMLHDPGKGPPGTGLGLFISKRIVEQHGGRIWAESRGPGTGLTIRFTLPGEEASNEGPPGETRPIPVDGHHGTVS